MLLLADALATVPFTIGMLLAGSFCGWMLGREVGLVIGGIAGLGVGVWLDLAASDLARRLRWPVAVGIVCLLAYAFAH